MKFSMFRGSRKKCFLCIVVTFIIICVNIQWQIVEKWREKRMQEGRGLIGKLFKKWINVIYRAVACLGGGHCVILFWLCFLGKENKCGLVTDIGRLFDGFSVRVPPPPFLVCRYAPVPEVASGRPRDINQGAQDSLTVINHLRQRKADTSSGFRPEQSIVSSACGKLSFCLSRVTNHEELSTADINWLTSTVVFSLLVNVGLSLSTYDS